ncbi:MAG: 6,7-dimethyl-8-ribityllumazine synthase [Halobacteriales archaeon SW_9_67_24]|nr:MAG: 6,7-dimethyl-8-ribityllumazine synthase [Halobacteriales archaeon SW_9_67_24]
MHSLGLVVARFYDDLAMEMEEYAHEAAAEHGAEITDTIPVPGAYDAPLAADRLARRESIAAVAVLGAVVSGDTDHDQVIARSAAKGLTDVSLDRDTPVSFGVVGPGMSGAEARERAEKGAEAVATAVDMVEALA